MSILDVWLGSKCTSEAGNNVYVYLHIILAARPRLQTRHPPPYLLRVRNKQTQFAKCEPFLEKCKSKLLKKIVKQLFLTINFFFIPNYFTWFAHLLTKRANKSHKLVL